jgi:hypothetical protein
VKYLELKEQFKDFVLFSLKDIKKVDPVKFKEFLKKFGKHSLRERAELWMELNIENKKMLKERLTDKLHEFNLKRLSKEIEPFLILKKDAAKVELFEEFIKSL